MAGKAGDSGAAVFEVAGLPDADGARSPVKGCKTDAKGATVQGVNISGRGCFCLTCMACPVAPERFLFRAASAADAHNWVQSITCVGGAF